MVSTEQPWHAAFPAPKPEYTAEVMPRNRALTVLSMRIASMLIVDVRRTDYEGGSIRGSLNIPAHGFWWNRGILYELCYKADIEWVVFTCGSSNGRGPRCASWFLEHVRDTVGDQDMNVLVLEGGVKGWVKSGNQYTAYMDGYKEDYWRELFAKEEEKDRNGSSGAAAHEPASQMVARAVGDGDVLK